MDNPHPNPAPAWLSDQAWSNLCEVEGVHEAFTGLRSSLATHNVEWRALYDSPTPHEQVGGGSASGIYGARTQLAMMIMDSTGALSERVCTVQGAQVQYVFP